ncbi:MAG: homocysteine S-methyltransferase family protein [Anaeromyxobacter sp.]
MSLLRPGTLLDGGLATGLYARGMPGEALPEEWVLTHPEDVAAVHAGHFRAGARVVLTATFNLVTPRLSARLGEGKDGLVAATAVGLARAAAPGARVAGSLGPAAVPGATPDLLAARYELACRALADAGADLAWLETQLELGEALAALAAARRAGLPAVVTFAFREERGRLVGGDGVPAEAWLSAAAALGAAAVGVNCVAASPALARVAFAAQALTVPFVVKPSPGPPGEVAAPDVFARAVAPVVEAGARIVGGCCGAGPEHLAALAPLVATAAAQVARG